MAALLAVLLAFVVRETFSFFAGPDFSEYVVFYPTVMIVALLAGLGPGLFAVLTTTVILVVLREVPWRILPFSPRTSNYVSLVFFTVVCGFLAVIADLYRRSRVKAAAYDKEQALRESQEALRRQAEMLRLSFDAIIVWKMTGGIESWNRGAEELYGYSEEEALGKGIHDLLRTRHTAPWDEFERMLRAQGQWDGELLHVTRSGTEVTVSSRLHIGHGADGELRVLEIDRDITEQKQAQRDLQRARDELEEKVQQRTADLQKANRNLLMISACDQALVQMSDERELIAVICHIIQEEGRFPLVWVGMAGVDGAADFRCVASAGDRGGFLNALRADGTDAGLADGPAGKALLTGEPVVVDDLSAAAEEGRWKEEALRRGLRGAAALPLLSASAAALGVLVIYSDATPSFEKGNLSLLGELVNDLAFGVMSLRARGERDEAQQALEMQARQLRTLAGELVRTEQRERRRIAQLLHDQLQQHLAAALYGLNEFKGHTTPDGRAETVERVGALLRDSISMSRSLTSELGHPALTEPDISVGLEWLAAWMKEKHGLEVTVEAPAPTVLPAEDVRITLLQAVRELLFNVVKHAGTGKARVTLDKTRGDRIQIAVSDDGAGFDAAREASLREPGPGGIGLFSIRERLALSGGGIEVVSAPGKGSTVTAWVPISAIAAVAPPVAPAAPVRGPAPRSAGGKIRLLLADDHAVVRDGLVLQLGQQPDIEVVGVAADGEQAVALSGTLLPDVVTMDVGMPGMGGIEAARRIHAQHPDIAIIGVSMYDDATHAAAMREAGAVVHLSKSASIDTLLGAIRGAASARIPPALS